MPPAAAAIAAKPKSTVGTPIPAPPPARGPAATAASTNSRLTAPTCIATASPAINPVIRAAVGSMQHYLTACTAEFNVLTSRTATIAAMDAIDSEIVRLLRDDARLSWRDLGAAVGLSANAAADRVRRLRRAGVITGFAAQIDPAAGGRQLEAVISVTLLPGTDSDEFAAMSDKLAPVSEVLHLAGTPDYQLRVACHDTAEIDSLLRTLAPKLGVAD